MSYNSWSRGIAEFPEECKISTHFVTKFCFLSEISLIPTRNWVCGRDRCHLVRVALIWLPGIKKCPSLKMPRNPNSCRHATSSYLNKRQLCVLNKYVIGISLNSIVYSSGHVKICVFITTQWFWTCMLLPLQHIFLSYRD